MLKSVKQASIITTYRCNAQCNMCNIWKHPTDASREVSVGCCERLPAGLRINITGGEATLRTDIEELCAALYDKSTLLELSTNGYYTDRVVALARRFPRMLIRVSVEGLPSVNDAKRGLRDGFDHALRTMLELKKTSCRNIGFSVVISPDNYQDLLPLYELCVALDVELATSVVHNSWYFHKLDNQETSPEALKEHERFVAALLTSRRRRLKARLKDYGRAYFNIAVHHRLAGETEEFRPPCGAGTDFFFIDPTGNVTPCNGSEQEWVMGNLNDNTLDEIMDSPAAAEAMEHVRQCKRQCAFIVTERHDMVRRPWKSIWWIVRNKWRLWRGKSIVWA